MLKPITIPAASRMEVQGDFSFVMTCYLNNQPYRRGMTWSHLYQVCDRAGRYIKTNPLFETLTDAGCKE